MRHVDVALDAALLELHVVLRQGPSLVCEDVLHLRTQGALGSAALTPEAEGRPLLSRIKVVFLSSGCEAQSTSSQSLYSGWKQWVEPAFHLLER